MGPDMALLDDAHATYIAKELGWFARCTSHLRELQTVEGPQLQQLWINNEGLKHWVAVPRVNNNRRIFARQYE